MSEIFQGRERHVLGWVIVVVIGLSTLFIHVRHLVDGGLTELVTVFFNVFFPAFISLALIGASGWLATKPFTGNEALTIGAWTFAGFLMIASVTGAMIVFLVGHAPSQDILNTTMTVATVGGVTGFGLGVYDVYSDRARERLRRERNKAERLNQRLDVLNRVFRHDIRQEISIMQGNVALAKDKTSENQEELEVVEGGIKEITRINEQIRDIQNTVESATEQEDICIQDIIRQTIREVISDDHSLTVTVDGDSDVFVNASKQLQVAFENIIENSVEHAQAGKITITTHPGDGQDDPVEIAFEDDGTGLPPGELDVIQKGAETQLHHSDGMGLWLVKWIVQESGGSVTIDSSADGTRIVIELEPAEDQSNIYGILP